MKKLVAFFSATGTTKRKAEELARQTGADLYEIEPLEPYSAADLNWNDKGSRSSVEMDNPASRPALGGSDLDVSEYDVIYLGFPIWWYIAPRIVKTFLETHDLAGKTIVVWATSGGSGLGKTVGELAESASDATFVEGGMANSAGATERIASKG